MLCAEIGQLGYSNHYMSPLRKLTVNLGQKLWITFGLGAFGIGLFLIVIAVLSYILDPGAVKACLDYGSTHSNVAMLWGFGFLLYFCVTLYIFRVVVKLVYQHWYFD